MKVERQLNQPSIHTFAPSVLPRSLVVGSCLEGYSRTYYIYAGKAPWIGRGHPVAELDGATIRLFETNYFSDIEALAMAYEKATGFEVTLKYWQAPKDDPLPSAAPGESTKEKT